MRPNLKGLPVSVAYMHEREITLGRSLPRALSVVALASSIFDDILPSNAGLDVWRLCLSGM
jgi:hypothetical protein